MDLTSEYVNRLNRAVDYIESHVDEALTVEAVASAACLSQYHFNRIFSSFMNESVYAFISRLRVEKAAAMLSVRQDLSITDAAFAYGFNDSATFARAFKRRFSVSASEWRRHGRPERDSRNDQAFIPPRGYPTDENNHLKEERVRPIRSGLRDFGPITVAYVRHIGGFAGDGKLFVDLYEKLYRWAKPRGLGSYPESMQVVAYHDAAGITDKDRLRISVGISVPEGTMGDGEIGILRIARGRYLTVDFKLGQEDYARAWRDVFRIYLPRAGALPADGPCLELYCHDMDEPFTEESETTICVPVLQP